MRASCRGNPGPLGPGGIKTRKRSDVEAWLKRHNFPALEVTDIKRPFWLILDDRAMPFDGHFDDALLERIASFKPYWIDGGPAKGQA
jgi:hypothetical protein